MTSTVTGFLPADPVCDTCGSPLAPAAQDAGSVEQRLNERLRRSRPEPRSEVDVAKGRAKPLVLSDYLRQTLTVKCDRFADEMLRLMNLGNKGGKARTSSWPRVVIGELPNRKGSHPKMSTLAFAYADDVEGGPECRSLVATVAARSSASKERPEAPTPSRAWARSGEPGPGDSAR